MLAAYTTDLCSILGIHWPHYSTFSNEVLYKRCNTRFPSDIVAEANGTCKAMCYTWTNILQLRMPYSRYAVVGAKKYRGKSGRHTTNFLDIVKADIKLRNLNLRNTTDLKLLT